MKPASLNISCKCVEKDIMFDGKMKYKVVNFLFHDSNTLLDFIFTLSAECSGGGSSVL